MRSLVYLPFCLVLFLLCRTAETSQRSSNCCLKTFNCRINKDRVVDYRVQNAGVCAVSAIVLRIKQSKTKCCNPDSKWTKDIMEVVDQKKMSKQNSDPKVSPS
ncbi:C-C motif chemokine 32b.3 [Pimephales promelas]|uniref:C-C motif chemokine 32b.3 n=1 Tax=Pimephales promelas TaxID=90988 RepID=UPI001955E6CC|nr:C-C motif chemokine 32b.3 [Pimephales promelas]